MQIFKNKLKTILEVKEVKMKGELEAVKRSF